jgi:hypothetical protein
VKRISSTSIIYTPRPDATPETEAAALAAVYKLVIDALQGQKRVTGPGGGSDDVSKAKDVTGQAFLVDGGMVRAL